MLIARVLEVKRASQRRSAWPLPRERRAAHGPIDVVCGAPNVTAGRRYPYAPSGAMLPGGLTLERPARSAAMVSNGMLCSARELGLGPGPRRHPGARHRRRAGDAASSRSMPIADDQIHLDVTANRPDLLCHKGVARELAAAYDARIKLPEIPGAVAVSRSRATAVRRTRATRVPSTASRFASRMPRDARATWPP